MAKSKISCKVCNNTVEFCESCMLNPQPWMNWFDCEKCKDIFEVLSQNGTGKLTDKETCEMLDKYNLDVMDLRPEVKNQWNKIKVEINKFPKKEDKKW